MIEFIVLLVIILAFVLGYFAGRARRKWIIEDGGGEYFYSDELVNEMRSRLSGAYRVDPDLYDVSDKRDPGDKLETIDEAIEFENWLLAGQEWQKTLLRQLSAYQARDEALGLGDTEEDRAGFCTVRELAVFMIDTKPDDLGEYVREISFTDNAGREINVEFIVTSVDGVQYSRKWAPEK